MLTVAQFISSCRHSKFLFYQRVVRQGKLSFLVLKCDEAITVCSYTFRRGQEHRRVGSIRRQTLNCTVYPGMLSHPRPAASSPRRDYAPPRLLFGYISWDNMTIYMVTNVCVLKRSRESSFWSLNVIIFLLSVCLSPIQYYVNSASATDVKQESCERLKCDHIYCDHILRTVYRYVVQWCHTDVTIFSHPHPLLDTSTKHKAAPLTCF